MSRRVGGFLARFGALGTTPALVLVLCGCEHGGVTTPVPPPPAVAPTTPGGGPQ